MEYVFLHGLGQGSGSWDGVLAALPGLFAHCPDLPSLLGAEGADYPALYQRFAAYCGALPGPLHLCGLSLGAVLALDYAIQNPGRTASLALIAPQYKMPRLLLGFQSMVFRFLPEASFQGTGFSRRDFLSLTGSMASLDFPGELGNVQCPTLVLVGERDGANRKAAQSLAALLPQGELHILPGAGHEANTDAPQALAAALEMFYHSF